MFRLLRTNRPRRPIQLGVILLGLFLVSTEAQARCFNCNYGTGGWYCTPAGPGAGDWLQCSGNGISYCIVQGDCHLHFSSDISAEGSLVEPTMATRLSISTSTFQLVSLEFLLSKLNATNAQTLGDQVERNCRGNIVDRHFTRSMVATVRQRTTQIEV